MLNPAALIEPHDAAIFAEELGAWHRLQEDWPNPHDLKMFLEWFDIEVHSLVIDLGAMGTQRAL